jgi:hypothetical protein
MPTIGLSLGFLHIIGILVHRVNRKTNLLPESSVSHLSIMYFSSDKHHEIRESRQNILHTFARDFFLGAADARQRPTTLLRRGKQTTSWKVHPLPRHLPAVAIWRRKHRAQTSRLVECSMNEADGTIITPEFRNRNLACQTQRICLNS